MAPASPAPGGGSSFSSPGPTGAPPTLDNERQGWAYLLGWLWLGFGAYNLGLLLALPELAIGWLSRKLVQDVLPAVLVALVALASKLVQPAAPAVHELPLLLAGSRSLHLAALLLLNLPVVAGLRRLAGRGGRWRYAAIALAAGRLTQAAISATLTAFPALLGAPLLANLCLRACMVGVGLLFLSWWYNRLCIAGEEVHQLFGGFIAPAPAWQTAYIFLITFVLWIK